VRAGNKEVSVRLDPAELGVVEVRWSTDEQGRVRTVVAAENPATLDLLKRDAQQLARALNDAGVPADTSSFQFDLRREGQQQQAPRQPLPAAYAFTVAATGDDPAAPPPYARTPGRAAPGRVDMII
jgi:chemotaxis protein MotD